MKQLKLITSLIILALFVSGCTTSPSTPERPAVDVTLPKVENIKTISGITDVGFEWNPTYDSRVNGYHIYRANASEQSMQRVATINDRYTSHYVDTKLAPSTNYIYRMSTFSNTKQESESSATINVVTNPTIESVSFLTALTGLPNRVKLIWRPHTSPVVNSYLIERSEINNDKWSQIATVSGRLNAEYIDSGLTDSKSYKYRVRVKTYDGLTSGPSTIVEAITKPLPPIVENLKATRDEPKRVVISWSPSSKEDIAYYKVYRASSLNLFYSYLAKTNDTTFEDLLNDNGVARYYYVTAVDKDELESPRQVQPAMGTTLAVPDAPIINVVKQDGRSILLGWSDSSNRAVKYNITKKHKDGSLVLTNISSNSYIDSDVLSGVEYTYTIVAIDAFGLSSKSSEKIVVSIPQE
ncbi:MAG: fibronectin type III domain-containing protein [Campylobacteraceae bacterium]